MANRDDSLALNGTFLVPLREGVAAQSVGNAQPSRDLDQKTSSNRKPISRYSHEDDDAVYQSYRYEAQANFGPGVRPELVHDEANLLPFHFLRAGDRIGRAVVKIQREDGATGTGFLVASDILLTNHHVLPDIESASVAVALANYEANPPDDPAGRSTVAPLDPHSLFVTNAELDFTFCGVRGLEFLGSVQLDRQQMHVAQEEIVNIIQHPRGRPKEVVLRDNWVVRADSVVLHYSCDTEPGSSGSPVFNNAWKPVALHHASVLTDSPEGRMVSENDSGRYINEGIRLSAIALWLETAEANTRVRREQVARLRALFGGLNGQVGFFGALGRRSQGRTAPELVADIDTGERDSIDIGYWNTRSLGGVPRDRLSDFAQIMAEMGLDVWCLTYVDSYTAESLCHLLRAGHRQEYECVRPLNEMPRSPVFLVRKQKEINVEWLQDRGVDPYGRANGAASEAAALIESEPNRIEDDGSDELPTCSRVRITLGRGSRGQTAIVCVIVHRRSQLKAIRQQFENHDCLVLGDAATLLSSGSHTDLDANNQAWIAASSNSAEHAMAWSPSPSTYIDDLFTTPNLYPAEGFSDGVHAVRDRSLPSGLRSFHGSQPIAVRLMLSEKRAGNWAEPPPAALEDGEQADLEHRVRQALEPMISRLIAELRGKV